MSRVEIHHPPEVEQPLVEIVKRRDTKLVKKALGKSASHSLKARSVKEAVHEQNKTESIELKKNQLETVQHALGTIATEKGISKVFKRRRARKLARSIKTARHILNE